VVERDTVNLVVLDRFAIRRARSLRHRYLRSRGYATDNEENKGVVCVALPIFGSGGAVLAAASTSGPAARMHRTDLGEMGAMIAAQMLAAAREMGHDGEVQSARSKAIS